MTLPAFGKKLPWLMVMISVFICRLVSIRWIRALAGGLTLGRVHLLMGAMQAHGAVSGFAVGAP
jgi:hypothetical protein